MVLRGQGLLHPRVTQVLFSCCLAVRPCLDSRLVEHADRRALMSLALTIDAAAERCEKVGAAGQLMEACTSSAYSNTALIQQLRLCTP